MEDLEIVELYWLRDESALEETARKYGRYCYSIAYGILHNEADAEECVNDAYTAVWRAIPPHRPDVFSVFLGKITRRLALKSLRKKEALKRGGGEVPLILDEFSEAIPSSDNAAALETEMLTEALNRFLEDIPVSERRVFLCRYWYFDSIKEISSRFGFGESRVKMMLKRTRDKLYAYLLKEDLL